MKNIIVPTDFSGCALNALRVAADIARKDGKAVIHLVHVYDRPISGITLQFFINSREHKRLRESIHDLMEKLIKNEFLKGLKIRRHLLSDKEVWEIVHSDFFKDADMVIIGTHGASGWREFFIGSNTQKIVQLADCPVLAIKDQIEVFNLKNMVFASNFYHEADSVFVKIKKFANLYDTTVHLLKVNTRNHFNSTHRSIAAMKDFAEKFYLKKYTLNIYDDETVEDGILNFSNSLNPDLIAMETHGRTGLAHLLNPSITEHVVNHIWRPVLSVKIKHELEEYGIEFQNKPRMR